MGASIKGRARAAEQPTAEGRRGLCGTDHGRHKNERHDGRRNDNEEKVITKRITGVQPETC